MKNFILFSMVFVIAFGQYVLAANDDYAITQIHVFSKSDGETYYYYDYNDKGLMTRETVSPQSGNEIKFEFEYDANNNLIRRTHKQNVNGNWENTIRHNYIYENNQLVLRISQKWDVDAFKDYMKIYYEYNDDGKEKYEKMEELIDGKWKKQYDLTYSYYDNYYQIIWYAYKNDSIANGIRYKYEYNEFGKIGTEYQDYWYMDDWALRFRKTNYYWNTNHRLSYYILEQYIEDKWTNISKVEYEYNFQDKLAIETTYSYYDGDWTKNLMRNYQYDSLKNMVVTTWNIWQNDSWEFLDNTINLKFYEGNLADYQYFHGYRFEFSYDKLLSVEDNQSTVTISPNPAKDYIVVNFIERGVNSMVDDHIKIYNMLGEIVLNQSDIVSAYSKECGKYRIDISGLVPGVYFLRFGNCVQRFIKY